MRESLLLSSSWEFFEPTGRKWLEARVPGCIHSDLLRHGLIPDPFWGRNELDLQWIEEKNWDYRCTFEVDAALLRNERLEVVAEGLDTLATLKLNGRKVGSTANMFREHRFDVKAALREGTNVLEIHFASPLREIRKRLPGIKEPLVEWNDAVGGSSLLRKQGCSFGWDWGPRFVTSGVWLPIRLEAWSEDRIQSVRVVQKHAKNQKRVDLVFEPALAVAGRRPRLTGTISLGGKTIAKIENGRATIANPELWWPNGLGDQPLYTATLELRGVAGDVIDTWTRRIGLREIVLDRHKDEFGETFQFVVNRRAIFAKGANWVPAHALAAAASPETYADLLTSAADANMNMLRIWGGNIYEKGVLYDLCDEKGLLIWQDFMFACALYPGDKAFVAEVRAEAAYQVARLSHHACLALWCGNNEIEQMPQEILKTPARKKAYEEIFYRVLPEEVRRWDGTTPYWPSSPHNPEGWEKGHNNERAGDGHFWDVWHARAPVKSYEQKKYRFCSEFGMQSYSSPEVAATFCPPESCNAFGPEMENHQKNGAGNQIIMDYVSRLYRFPKDYAALAYLSQLNQAHCMKIGIEHFRRSMPRTMGALYWQLNDCWPVASWSSIEFGGAWKALHYAARRFFAPALVSAHVPGDEIIGKNNSVTSTVHDVDLYTVYDGIKPTAAVLRWSLEHLSRKRKGAIRTGTKQVRLRPMQSVRQLKLDFAAEMKTYGADQLYLRLELETAGGEVSRQTVFLTTPRRLPLLRGKITTRLKQTGPREWALTLASSVYQHAVQFHFRGTSYRAEDNFFDLYPGTPREVKVRTREDLKASGLKSSLAIRSLADSY